MDNIGSSIFLKFLPRCKKVAIGFEVLKSFE
jgi:hypothetical protein